MSSIQENLYQVAVSTQNLINSVKDYIDNIFLKHKEEIIKLLTKNYSEGVILPKIYKWFEEEPKENNKITKFEYKFKTPAKTWTNYNKLENIIKFKFISKRGELYTLEINIEISCKYNDEDVYVEYDGEFRSFFHKDVPITKKIKKSFYLNNLGEKKEEDDY